MHDLAVDLGTVLACQVIVFKGELDGAGLRAAPIGDLVGRHTAGHDCVREIAGLSELVLDRRAEKTACFACAELALPRTVRTELLNEGLNRLCVKIGNETLSAPCVDEGH